MTWNKSKGIVSEIKRREYWNQKLTCKIKTTQIIWKWDILETNTPCEKLPAHTAELVQMFNDKCLITYQNDSWLNKLHRFFTFMQACKDECAENSRKRVQHKPWVNIHIWVICLCVFWFPFNHTKFRAEKIFLLTTSQTCWWLMLSVPLLSILTCYQLHMFGVSGNSPH